MKLEQQLAFLWGEEHLFPYLDYCQWVHLDLCLLFSGHRTKEAHLRLCSSGWGTGFDGSLCHCPHLLPGLILPVFTLPLLSYAPSQPFPY